MIWDLGGRKAASKKPTHLDMLLVVVSWFVFTPPEVPSNSSFTLSMSCVTRSMSADNISEKVSHGNVTTPSCKMVVPCPLCSMVQRSRRDPEYYTETHYRVQTEAARQLFISYAWFRHQSCEGNCVQGNLKSCHFLRILWRGFPQSPNVTIARTDVNVLVFISR